MVAEDDHRAAVETFLGQARDVPPDRWDVPRADDKWSPAQIAEHLRLTYATLRRELEGGTGFRQRVSRLRALFYRVGLLRRMLRRPTLHRRRAGHARGAAGPGTLRA
jgi:hypothetical protein